MGESGRKDKLQLVDLAGIGNLLGPLVARGTISCRERDAIIQQIARDNDFSEIDCSLLAGYRKSIEEVRVKWAHRELADAPTISTALNEGFVSLTELAHAHSEDVPGYVIQSWLRSGNTLAFLNLWEKENNPNYCEEAYIALLEKKKTASFTLTPKLWIDQTKAVGPISKQGKSGGTFAHPMIACEFASWLAPEFKMLLLKMSQFRDQFK